MGTQVSYVKKGVRCVAVKRGEVGGKLYTNVLRSRTFDFLINFLTFSCFFLDFHL